ncbi:MAG: anthranilate phosphoribosyltransferase [Bacteroidia bacterium]|nr:anthranilate phosphoribosyltransferase [Bacteroidia bacterium]
MKEALTTLFAHRTLSREEACNSLTAIASGEMNQSRMAAFLTAYIMRTPATEELQGFRSALLNLCLPADLGGIPVIDLCGTGGDGKNTFNISTLAAFVVAGAGVKVAKHGNYGVSSVSGSSNVLEAMGVKFTNQSSVLRCQLEKAGICFLHAPLFHPAMKSIGPVRKELGVKTFFNMLGPLVNPARPYYQCTGVYSMEMARLYRYILSADEGTFNVVHTYDGYDEISLTGAVKVFSRTGERTLSPEDFGFPNCNPGAIHGGDSVATAVAIFRNVLEGSCPQEHRNVVLANAALAISGALNKDYAEALEMAVESLSQGKALKALQTLLTHG